MRRYTFLAALPFVVGSCLQLARPDAAHAGTLTITGSYTLTLGLCDINANCYTLMDSAAVPYDSNLPGDQPHTYYYNAFGADGQPVTVSQLLRPLGGDKYGLLLDVSTTAFDLFPGGQSYLGVPVPLGAGIIGPAQGPGTGNGFIFNSPVAVTSATMYSWSPAFVAFGMPSGDPLTSDVMSGIANAAQWDGSFSAVMSLPGNIPTAGLGVNHIAVEFELTQTPEPASWTLALVGVGWLAARRFRRAGKI